MPELSQPIQQLIKRYQAGYLASQAKEGLTTIHVDEVAATVAAFYEKIREAVDWREEHLIRRAAIERVLKRRLFLKNDEPVAESLILELIRSGHFPNDRLAESKIGEIQKAIDKYVFILQNSPGSKDMQLDDWLLSIAACEVEEILSPLYREKALIEYMAESMTDKITVKGEEINEEEKRTQIFIAVQKALFKLDPPYIIYNLLKIWYPRWQDFAPADWQLTEIAQNIYSIWGKIESAFCHPLSVKFYKICERYDTLYLILGDIISEDPLAAEEKIKIPQDLENKITAMYQKRLITLRARIKRAALYSTTSIFASKILLALAVEVPFDRYITGQFNYLVLGLNILIPSLLMFFLVLTIRPPERENLQQIIMEIMKLVYSKEAKDVYTIKPARKRGWLMNAAITIFYLLTFFLTFGIIIWLLNKLHFGILSVIIFLVFISLIAFAGVKIRERARELEIKERREPFLIVLIDFFSLPIIQVGKWLSNQWTKYNVIITLINVLIDMPLQTFIEFLEQWRAFLKEKKEEIH